MTILALDCSTSQRSVALLTADGLWQALEVARGHTMHPLGLIEDVLRQAGRARGDIECLVLGLGPGSYTGIRVGLALAQGWQLARDVKMLGVSSVEAIAAGLAEAGAPGRAHVLVDAQRGEFYLAGYELAGGRATSATPLRLAGRAEVEALAAAGEGLFGPDLERAFPAAQPAWPRAATLARLAQGRTDFVRGELLEPIYLRETTFVKAPPPRLVPPLPPARA